MKSFILINGIVGLFIMSCSQHTAAVKDQAFGTLTNERWHLKNINKEGGIIAVPDSIAFISFDAAKRSAGGRGGCNNFGSSFSVDGSTIRFTEIFSTKMYCENTQNIETNFLEALNKASRYKIEGDKLQLLDDQEILLELER